MVPIYLKAEPLPVARLRIAELRTDFQRRGLFRIGLLPFLVAEGVRVEVLSSNRLDEVLRSAGAWRPSKGETRAMEWRKVSVAFGNDGSPALEAGVLQAMPRGGFRLSAGVRLHTPEGTLEWTEARWILDGGGFGRIQPLEGNAIVIPVPRDVFRTAPSPQ